MPFSFGDVLQNLMRKGFVEDSSKHHVFLHFYYEGKKTPLYTKCSHGADGDDVRHAAASAMKKQLAFDTRQQLDEFVSCTWQSVSTSSI